MYDHPGTRHHYPAVYWLATNLLQHQIHTQYFIIDTVYMATARYRSHVFYIFVPTAYPRGTILLAHPPSQPPPIKPDDNQPVVQPAEESPPASFNSSRSFGDSQTTALVTSESFAVTAPGKGQLQPPQNIPFPDLRSCGSDGDEINEGMPMESHDQNSRESLELEGEGNTNIIGNYSVPYSRKYWWELNLAVGSQMAIAKALADFNSAARYGSPYIYM